MLLVNDIVMANIIKLVGGNPRFDVGFNHTQHFGGQAPGDTHLFYFFGCFNINSHKHTNKSGLTGILVIFLGLIVVKSYLWYKARAEIAITFSIISGIANCKH